MTIYTNRAIIIIPATEQAQANAAAASLPGATAADTLTFTAPLNATGKPGDPVTHYWASAPFTAENWPRVQAMVPQFPGSILTEWNPETQPDLPDQVLATAGLKRIAPTGAAG